MYFQSDLAPVFKTNRRFELFVQLPWQTLSGFCGGSTDMLVWIVYVKRRPRPCQNPTPDSRETGVERPVCLFLLA